MTGYLCFLTGSLRRARQIGAHPIEGTRDAKLVAGCPGDESHGSGTFELSSGFLNPDEAVPPTLVRIARQPAFRRVVVIADGRGLASSDVVRYDASRHPDEGLIMRAVRLALTNVRRGGHVPPAPAALADPRGLRQLGGNLRIGRNKNAHSGTSFAASRADVDPFDEPDRGDQAVDEAHPSRQWLI